MIADEEGCGGMRPLNPRCRFLRPIQLGELRQRQAHQVLQHFRRQKWARDCHF
jgi:hypothetical protein